MNTMISVTDEREFLLSNARISYAFRASPQGILEHLYFGNHVSGAAGLAASIRKTYRTTTAEFEGVPYYHLADTPQEYPLFGTSDFRHPALHGVNADGNSIFTLRYDSHRISSDKPALPGLPSARGGDSETLVVTLKDAVYGLTVDLNYTIYRDYDVVCRSTTITNDGQHTIELLNVASSCLDLPADDYELLHLHGTWAREFNAERIAMPTARCVIESTRGTSSAAHNPFLAVMEKDATETSGRVYGTALMYSGSFAISIEKGEFEEVRVLTGINPFNFRWQLEPGASFNSPEVLQVYTDRGLSSMSRTWHRFIQDRISEPRFAHSARPSYFNTWEAAYFNVNETSILRLADRAKELGLEMLVVDDGWFEGRDSETTSLGDWQPDPGKFPSGIAALAKQVKQRGLKFGIWVEPEMVNEKSKLYQQHPDWILHVPHRKPSLGRYQYVLDYSRADVVEHMFNQLDELLSCGSIDYIKWDMNRLMTEAGSALLPAERQLETPHRYILGLYNLVQRITAKYPDVLFENCASGGNRYDLGMLRYMSQGWPSDMVDPVGRLSILNGASYLFPPSVLAAYVGPSPNHQNGRHSSLQARFDAAFFCAARGISLSEADLDRDADEIREGFAVLRESADDVVNGAFHRVFHRANETCWQLTSADGNSVYVGYYHVLSAPNLPFKKALLRDLDPNAEYRLTKNPASTYTGAALMHSGLALPWVDVLQYNPELEYMDKGDFSTCILVLEKVT
ncbi:alpha-galactosidase [Pseudomaricurvus alcaniphilus]|uniref:alpha-galactosidase n=1 Tax=Pseudomaricurvus alcaniphilus TaxID=1166482 RepID=UPI001409BEC4|nr:alpha-galactosidase [Pseudomaricurvus alcaniphilus]NHN35892.1 alpha-galactosidase [Pseudomaricurvus alcaniphilus]